MNGIRLETQTIPIAALTGSIGAEPKKRTPTDGRTTNEAAFCLLSFLGGAKEGKEEVLLLTEVPSPSSARPMATPKPTLNTLSVSHYEQKSSPSLLFPLLRVIALLSLI